MTRWWKSAQPALSKEPADLQKDTEQTMCTTGSTQVGNLEEESKGGGIRNEANSKSRQEDTEQGKRATAIKQEKAIFSS